MTGPGHALVKRQWFGRLVLVGEWRALAVVQLRLNATEAIHPVKSAMAMVASPYIRL